MNAHHIWSQCINIFLNRKQCWELVKTFLFIKITKYVKNTAVKKKVIFLKLPSPLYFSSNILKGFILRKFTGFLIRNKVRILIKLP